MAHKVTTFRPARSIDAIPIAEMFAQRVRESTYAPFDEVDIPLARKMFAQAVQRHGGTKDGATFLMVAEDGAGEIAAFIFATLGRVYGVGKLLAASDHYLVARKDAPARAAVRLFDAYFEWASANPRVLEVGGSFSDAFPGAELMGKHFRRRGFTPCAQTFRWRRV